MKICRFFQLFLVDEISYADSSPHLKARTHSSSTLIEVKEQKIETVRGRGYIHNIDSCEKFVMQH